MGFLASALEDSLFQPWKDRVVIFLMNISLAHVVFPIRGGG